MYFARISNEDEIKMHNIADLVVFNCVQIEGQGVLTAVADHVRTKVSIKIKRTRKLHTQTSAHA